MKTSACILLVLALAGVARAQYASLEQAVRAIPEVSQIAKRLGTPGTEKLAKTLSDPAWVGTVLIPTNAALDALSAKLGADLFSLVPAGTDMMDVLGNSIVPGVALNSATLKEGQKVKALSGETLTVSFQGPLKLESGGGKTIWINTAPVDTADIRAGKASMFLMGSPVVTQEYQSLLDSVQDPAAKVPPTKYATAAAAPAATPAESGASKTPAADVPAAMAPAADAPAAAAANAPAAAAAAAGGASAPAAAAATPAAPSPAVRSGAASVGLVAATLAVPALLAMLL